MSDKASIITLNYLIPGEEVSFAIEISTTNQVSILADKIRNRRLDLFKDTDSSKLILYINKGEADSVVILSLKNDKGAILSGTELMKPENTILSYFNGQPAPIYQGEKGINVIVYSPVVLKENTSDTGL